MYLDMVLIVDITEDVVAGDWMTAMWEDKLPDGILADDHRAFLVELLADDEFLNFLVLLFLRFLFLADKRRGVSTLTHGWQNAVLSAVQRGRGRQG